MSPVPDFAASILEVDEQIEALAAAISVVGERPDGLPARDGRFIRPPIERYLRCTVMFGAWTVEPGIEYHQGERLSSLLEQLQVAIGEAWHTAAPASIDDVPRLNEATERVIVLLWPDRAWFLEVYHAISGWTQIYQPYGIPRCR